MKGSNRQYVFYLLFSFFFAFLLFFGIHEAWAQRPELVPNKSEVPPAVKKTETPRVEEKGEKDDSFALISEKNLFSPERKEFQKMIVDVSKEVKKPVVRPQVTLYGVTIAGNYQSATLSVAGRALRKGERELMTLLTGERVGEYKLAKIFSDRVTLEAQEDSFEVFLYDPGSPKKRQYTKTENKPAAATGTLPTPGSPGTGSPAPGTAGATKTPAGSIPGETAEAQAPKVVPPANVPPNAPPMTWAEARRLRMQQQSQQQMQQGR